MAKKGESNSSKGRNNSSRGNSPAQKGGAKKKNYGFGGQIPRPKKKD